MNVNFNNPEEVISASEIVVIESNLGLNFPIFLKDLYLLANGGAPDPYVYEDDHLDTVVTNFFPITSVSGKRTAVDVYKHLVLLKKIAPEYYFPFAVDGGGDYFFIDCSSVLGETYFYRSDNPSDEDSLISLGIDIKEFFSKLKPENA